MIASWPSLDHRLGAVPGAARARGLEPPAVQPVEILEDAVLVLQHQRGLGLRPLLSGGFGTAASRTLAALPGRLASASVRAAPTASRSRRPALRCVERGIDQRDRPAERRRGLAPVLRAGLDVTPGLQILQNARQALGREVLVIVLVDLRHGRVDASAEAFDLGPGEQPVRRHVARLADQLAAGVLDLVGASQPARRRAADLHVIAADRRQIEHRVEGRDLVDADIGHAQHVGDIAERGLGQPAAHLLLRAPQDRQHGGGLPPFRIFLDLGLGPFEIFRGEGEALRLLGGEAADAHKSLLLFSRQVLAQPTRGSPSGERCKRESWSASYPHRPSAYKSKPRSRSTSARSRRCASDDTLPDWRVTASAGMKVGGADLEAVLGQLAKRHGPAVALRRLRGLPRLARRGAASSGLVARSPRPVASGFAASGLAPSPSARLPTAVGRRRRRSEPRRAASRKPRAARPRRPGSATSLRHLALPHRSISPNTMSIEPSTAETSASIWPLQRKSMAARWAKLGALILQR